MMMILDSDKQRRSYRVIWAFDPYASDYLSQRAALQVLKNMTEGMRVEITPVFLYGAHTYKSKETVSQRLLSQIQISAQQAVIEMTRDLADNEQVKICPTIVISEPFFQMRNATQELIHYARDQKSDCILLNTHARKGVSRVFLGSFSEELSLSSDVPILVVSPSCDLNVKKRIIFTTDFSEESRKAFLQIVELAKVARMSLIIFHQARYPLPPTVGYTFSPYPLYEGVSKEEVQLKRVKAEEWAQQGRQAGVDISIRFDEQQKRPYEGILDFVSENPGVLAMTARTGRFESVFLGSTVRHVLREGCCPIWIVHPDRPSLSSENEIDLPNQLRTENYAVWEGDLETGHGNFSTRAGGISSLPFTLRSRFSTQEGVTPESLLGTAEAACVAMSFSNQLQKRGLKAARIDVASTVKFENRLDQWRITSISLLATAFMDVGNRVAIQDAYQEAIHSSVITQALSVPVKSELEVKSPSMVTNELRRNTA